MSGAYPQPDLLSCGGGHFPDTVSPLRPGSVRSHGCEGGVAVVVAIGDIKSWICSVAILTSIAVVCLLLPAVTPANAAGQTSPITYVYDSLGRLEAVIDPVAPTNGLARYFYDAVGNLTSITRSPTNVVKIVDFHAAHAAVGASITIYGAGFNATASSNNVRFQKASNHAHGATGIAATVTNATQTTLTVTVPTGSESGPIYVKNNTSGSSDELGDTGGEKSFVLDGTLTPTISSISPTSARPGDTVTITGTKFVATDPAANAVVFNDTRAVVTSATSTQIQATVPPMLGSGAVEVRTPDGKATGTDLFVPASVPGADVDIANYVTKTRVSTGANTGVTVTNQGQAAVLVIAATKGQQIGVKASSFSGASAANQASVDIVDPFGRSFGDGVSIPQTVGSDRSIFAVDAHYDGDYAVVIKKDGTGAAISATIKIDVTDAASGGTKSAGQTASMTINKIGQEGTFKFTGTQGQTLNFDFSGGGNFIAGAMSVFQPSLPDGGPLGDGMVETTFGAGQSGDFAVQLPESGTFEYRYTPNPYNTDPGGTVTVAITLVSGRVAAGMGGFGQDESPNLIDSNVDPDGVESAALLAEGAAGEEAWVPDPNHLDRWTSDRAPSPLETEPLPGAPEGETALAGRVLRLNGAPLVEATVSVEGRTTTTGAAGQFLLRDLPPGEQVLTVDGASASTEDRSYGVFSMGVDLESGETSTLDHIVWMPLLDTDHEIRVAYPTRREIVLTNPTMPGFEVRIPEGAKITDSAGDPVRRIGITPIPIDRPPFPLPHDGFSMYFTLQPSDAQIDTGFQVFYPNYTNLPPGEKVGVHTYEADEGWERYGSARVDPSGQRIEPTPGTVAHDFAGVSFIAIVLAFFGASCDEDSANTVGASTCEGDPVDVTNGLWRYSKTDLAEPGPIPFKLTRIYRQNDGYSAHAFGVGTASAQEMSVTSTNDDDYVDLYIPGGRTVRFTPINGAGTGYPMRASGGQGRFASALLDFGLTDYHDSAQGDASIIRLVDGTRYIFSGLGRRLMEVRDRFGNEVITKYDAHNPLQSVSYPTGRWMSYAYAEGGFHITSVTDQMGRVVSYTYENPSLNVYRLKTITDPKQQGQPTPAKTTLGWDPSSVINSNPSPNDSPGTHLTSITDPRGNTAMTIHYDSSGRVDLQTLANGGTWTYAYSLASDPACQGAGSTKITDPNGNITCSRFSNNYIDSVTRAAGTSQARTTTYTRNANTKKVTSVVDTIVNPGTGDPATNRTTAIGYNADERMNSITRLSGTGQAVTTSYGFAKSYGQITLIDKPLNDDVTLAYTDGCLTRVEDPLAHGITMTCTTSGSPKTLTDDLGNQTTLTYSRGDLIKTTDPLSRSTNRFLDAAGRLTYVTDPLGYRTRMTYSALNELTKITDANGQTTTMVYDANSNMTDLTQDATSGHIGWAYNSINRVSTRTDQLGRVETYTYDNNGNVKTWQNRRSQTQRYCYDPFNRVNFTGYDGPDSGASCASSFVSTTGFTWDNGGRLRQVVDSLSGTITRAHDDLDRLTSETTPQGQVSYTWDNSSRRATMTVQGQTQVVYDYFRSDLPKSITQGTAVVNYAYDNANRPDTMTLANGIVQDYTLDAASGLTKISYDKGATNYGAINYTYDGAGRRQGAWGSWARTGLPAATTSNATYNVQNQLTSWNGTAIGYDLDANMTSNGANTLSWDARGQLSSTSQGTVGYGYDGLGRRISRTASGATAKYLFDGLQMIQEQNGTGTVTANTLAGQGIDQPLRRVETAGTTRNYLTDGLGSVIGLADGQSTPTVPTSYTYEAYGAQTVTGTAATNPFGFTAREYDSANGLQFNRARSMSPTFGRFISEDPIDIAGGMNLYGYAGNAPSVFTDPLGLEPDCVFSLPDAEGCFDWQEIFILAIDLGAFVLSGLALVALGASVAGVGAGTYFFLATSLSVYGYVQSQVFDYYSGNLSPGSFGTGLGTNVAAGVGRSAYYLGPFADAYQFLFDFFHSAND